MVSFDLVWIMPTSKRLKSIKVLVHVLCVWMSFMS